MKKVNVTNNNPFNIGWPSMSGHTNFIAGATIRNVHLDDASIAKLRECNVLVEEPEVKSEEAPAKKAPASKAADGGKGDEDEG